MKIRTTESKPSVHVAYDPSSGRVLLVHRLAFFGGATDGSVAASSAERTLRGILSKLKIPRANEALIVTHPSDKWPEGTTHVDLRSKRPVTGRRKP